MSKLLLCIAVFALAVRPARAETLTIFTAGSAGPDEAIRAEVGRLMAPAGFSLDWKKMSDRQAGEDYAHLIVVRFDGACAADVAPPPAISSLTSRSLASTVVSDGRVLPFATIHCETMRAVMAPALTAASRSARSGLFSRAVARVLAHEVYHMVARSKTHSAGGVSKSCFGVEDLTAEGFAFDRASLAQMRPLGSVQGSIEASEEIEPAGR